MLELTKAQNRNGLFQGTKGEPLAMGLESVCDRAGCSRKVVTALGDKNYCFDHFCSRCYELLERNERNTELAVSRDDYQEELLALDECARRALEISLGRAELHNLDRARLLDILLWTGDLTSSLRYRRVASEAFAVSSGKAGATGS